MFLFVRIIIKKSNKEAKQLKLYLLATYSMHFYFYLWFLLSDGEKKLFSKQPVPQNHKEQEELRKKRKISANPAFTLLTSLKVLWEEGRVKQTTKVRKSLHSKF